MSASQLPLVERLPAGMTAEDAFVRLAALPRVVFFDSAVRDAPLGRYSFVAADPFEWLQCTTTDGDPLDRLHRLWQTYRADHRPNLPPFQGGIAGLLGYELGHSLERVPAAAHDDLPTPPMAVGAYDVVVAFDHAAGDAWLISQGFPEIEPAARVRRAADRLAHFRTIVEQPPGTRRPAPSHAAAACDTLAPQTPLPFPGVTSNMSREDYRGIVRKAVEYIHSGDVFQVNLAQRLLARATAPSIDLYLRLRRCNPAPYAGYLDLGDAQIASASPECFLTLRDGHVETRPIKGTRGRPLTPEADLFAGDELSQSEKDRAENVMIVDLMRNDLSRVCHADSVHVAQLCRLETFAYVKHLVSVVRGELSPGRTPVDLLRASFPGGSITGAPKVRAMQIIAELEPTARGPYCGSLAYLGFNGTLDANILIRTITAAHGWWQFPVGGGIVADSVPDDEYHETWQKARGLLKAIL